jgi:hypothetical protein
MRNVTPTTPTSGDILHALPGSPPPPGRWASRARRLSLGLGARRPSTAVPTAQARPPTPLSPLHASDPRPSSLELRRPRPGTPTAMPRIEQKLPQPRDLTTALLLEALEAPELAVDPPLRQLLGQMRQLDLHGTRLGLPRAARLGALLAHAARLEVLVVRRCGLDALATAALLQGMGTQHRLRVLDVSQNPLGDDGLRALVPLLHRCRTLEVLRLGMTSMTDVGAWLVYRALGPLRNLVELDVGGNNKLRSGVAVAVQLLRNNANMRVCSLSEAAIDRRSLEALGEALRQARCLEQLSLANCAIEGGVALLRAELAEVLQRRPPIINLAGVHGREPVSP